MALADQVEVPLMPIAPTLLKKQRRVLARLVLVVMSYQRVLVAGMYVRHRPGQHELRGQVARPRQIPELGRHV